MPATILSVTSPATYRILRTALTRKEPFHQLELSREAHTSLSQANRVVQWLSDKRHVERLPDGRYKVRGAAGLVSSVFPYQRSMSDAQAVSLNIRGSKKEVIEALTRAGGILCLESALEAYSQFFRSDRVCVYHENPEELAKQLEPYEGGILPVQLYVPDIPLEGDVEEQRRTTRFRTVIDLACDGKLYAAKELLEELWGVVLE